MLRRSTLNQWTGWVFIAVVGLAAAPATPALSQVTKTVTARTGVTTKSPDGKSTRTIWRDIATAQQPRQIVSSQIELATERARLQLELDDGRSLSFELRDGQAWVGTTSYGSFKSGDPLDRSWRDLLTRAMDTPTEELRGLLLNWFPVTETGMLTMLTRREHLTTGPWLHSGIVLALNGGVPGAITQLSDGDEDASFDTVAALNRKIAELEQRLDQEPTVSVSTSGNRRARVARTIESSGTSRNSAWYSPLRHIGRGFVAILSDLVILAVLVGIGFVTVFFGRKYLEPIAETARTETMRAGLVGLAGTFLVLPGYILGIVALAISIVGIPLLLAWVPLFWVALSVAALFGYLAVAHGVGESLAERRYYGGDWARRTNSYYYVLTGLITLLALFIASHAVQMAGPWFGFIRGLLQFLAIVLTWAAFTIGFGAVLLTRAGTRPRSKLTPAAPDLDMDDLFQEDSHV